MRIMPLQKQSQFPPEVSSGHPALHTSNSVRAGLKPAPTVPATGSRRHYERRSPLRKTKPICGGPE